MEIDPKRVNELRVGLGADVEVVGAMDATERPLRVVAQLRSPGTAVRSLRRYGAVERHQAGEAGGVLGRSGAGAAGVGEAPLALPG